MDTLKQHTADDTSTQELARLFALQRATHLTQGAPSAELRIDRLNRCIALLKENADLIETTISADFGNRSRHASGITDVMSPIEALKHSRDKLKKSMRPERRSVEPFPLGLLGARSEIRLQPKGVIGILSPWNFPVGLVFSPLAGVLAAACAGS